MPNNYRFRSTYFKVNALLVRKYISGGDLFESKLYTVQRFRVADIYHHPSVLRIATTITYKLYELYPEYSIRNILISTIPADENIPEIELKLFFFNDSDIYYTTVGRNFDLETGEALFVRFIFPHIGYVTYEITKQDEDYLPVVLDKEVFIHHRPIPISQLHISSTFTNNFPMIDLNGDFARPRHRRLL